ncbi:MAG: phosphoenolpyruvate carboxykinase domain-containing protein, partial [bacterium]
AILFGGRRASIVPLVNEAFNWQHGTFLGSSVSSEMTAAAAGKLGQVRHDPFAMLPFCGYNMGDYFNHWLSIGKKSDASKLPMIFYVNWFRKDDKGKFIWPGYGDNIRVLKWIFERLEGKKNYEDRPYGRIPAKGSLDLSGLNMNGETQKLFEISKEEGLTEANELREYYKKFGDKLPKELTEELDQLEERYNKL